MRCRVQKSRKSGPKFCFCAPNFWGGLPKFLWAFVKKSTFSTHLFQWVLFGISDGQLFCVSWAPKVGSSSSLSPWPPPLNAVASYSAVWVVCCQVVRSSGDGKCVQPRSDDLQRVVRLQPIDTRLGRRWASSGNFFTLVISRSSSRKQRQPRRMYAVRCADGRRMQSSYPSRPDHHWRRRFLPPSDCHHWPMYTRPWSSKGITTSGAVRMSTMRPWNVNKVNCRWMSDPFVS